MAIIISVSFLLAALAEFFLVSFLLTKNVRSNFHQLAAARMLMVALFALFSLFFYNASTYENAVFWARARTIPFIFFPVLAFFFTWFWTQKRRGWPILVLFAFLGASTIFFQYLNLTTNLLGYPVQDPLTAWTTVIAGDALWPLIFYAWAFLLMIFTVILSVFHCININDPSERESQLWVLLPVPAATAINIILGLLPIPYWQNFLLFVPFWILAADIFTAIGLTSRKIFLLNFASVYYPVIQSINEAVVLVDLDSSICAANATFCKWVDKSESSLIAQPLSQFLQDESLLAGQSRKELLRKDRNWRRADLVASQGKTIPTLLSPLPVYQGDHLRGIAVLISDQSRIIEAEATLDSLKAEINLNYEKRIQDLDRSVTHLEEKLQESERQQQQYYQRVQELEELADLTGELRSFRTTKDFMDLVLLKTAAAISADAGVLFIRIGNRLVVKSSFGMAEDFKGYQFFSNQNYLGSVLDGDQAIFMTRKADNQTNEFPAFFLEMSAAALCPIKTAENKTSLIVLGFKDPGPISGKNRPFFDAVIKVISNALAYSGIMETLEQAYSNRDRELETLFRISSITSESKNPETILSQALQLLVETLSAKVGVIFIHQQIEEIFVSSHSNDSNPAIEDELRLIPLQNSLWGFIFRTNQPMLIKSIEEDNRIDVGIVTELISLGNCTTVCTPIRISNKVAGAMCLFRDVEQPFQPEDLALLNTVSNQLGIAIEVTRLLRLEEQGAATEEHFQNASQSPVRISQLMASQVRASQSSIKAIQNGEQASAVANLEQIGSSSLEALKEFRLLSHLLTPGIIDSLGLYGAIQQRLKEVEEAAFIHATLNGEYTCRLPGNLEKKIFQIVQDALNLILRKSLADEVNVRLDSDYDSILVEICHNGANFAQGEPAELARLRQEVEAVSGELMLFSGSDNIQVMQIKVMGK